MTMATWTSEYIGIPYVDKGRGPDEFDCWGLVRAVLADQYEIEVPSYVEEYTSCEDRLDCERLIHVEKTKYRKVVHPDIGNLVLIRIMGHAQHVGIVCDLQPLRMLHILPGVHSVIERLDSINWKRRAVGFYAVE